MDFIFFGAVKFHLLDLEPMFLGVTMPLWKCLLSVLALPSIPTFACDREPSTLQCTPYSTHILENFENMKIVTKRVTVRYF